MAATKTYRLIGGTDTLQLEEGGKVYVPGDEVPVNDAQIASLAQQGIYFAGVELPSTGAQQSAEIGHEFKK